MGVDYKGLIIKMLDRITDEKVLHRVLLILQRAANK